MAILYADPISAGLARSGEIRFEPESGLAELQGEWPNLAKRVIPLRSTKTRLRNSSPPPLGPDWTIAMLAEELLETIAAQSEADDTEYVLDAVQVADRQSQRLLRPLLACLATKSAAESGTAANLCGGDLRFQRTGPAGPVWIVGQFENRPGEVHVVFRRVFSHSQQPDLPAGVRIGLVEFPS